MPSPGFVPCVVSLAALSVLVLSGCSKPVPAEEPVRAVKVLTVAVEGFQSGAEFAGEVRARVESRLGFRVAGKIIQRPVEAGQRVKAGQLLAQLDAQDFRLAADAAKAQVAAAATNRNLAEADYKRFKELKDQSTTESEYISLSQALREVIPMMRLLTKLHAVGFAFHTEIPKMHCKVFEDNSGALTMARTPKMRPRTKHLNIKYHHFREAVHNGLISIHGISTENQWADIFTKPLGDTLFLRFRLAIMGW